MDRLLTFFAESFFKTREINLFDYAEASVTKKKCFNNSGGRANLRLKLSKKEATLPPPPQSRPLPQRRE
jgi:hypothetical protein